MTAVRFEAFARRRDALAVASRSILADQAMTATITLGMGAVEVEAVRDAHDLDAVRAQLLEGRQGVGDAAPREPV